VVQGGSYDMMYYVYVLFSLKDKKFYIGFSADVQRRLEEHNQGKNISTKPRRPFVLIYYEGHYSKADAQRRERYFKTTKGKATLKQMLRQSISDVSVLGEISINKN